MGEIDPIRLKLNGLLLKTEMKCQINQTTRSEQPSSLFGQITNQGTCVT